MVLREPYSTRLRIQVSTEFHAAVEPTFYASQCQLSTYCFKRVFRTPSVIQRARNVYKHLCVLPLRADVGGDGD